MHWGAGLIVAGPDIAPAKFKSRREAKDWCVQRYPGSPPKTPPSRTGFSEGVGGR